MTLKPGLVHTPVTPFTADNRIDYGTLSKLIAFHLANGADALAVPMHVGESVSLPDADKRELIAFTVAQVKGRVPVIAHASDSGTAIAADLARFAEKAGVAAIVSTTPYYWTPPPAMILEHLALISNAVKIPFFVHNAPDDMAGVKINAELCCKLIGRADNFAGVLDSGLDWQFMIELMTDAPKLRPDFQLLTGVEYLVSAAAIGATGMFSPLAGIVPRSVRRLYELCRDDKLVEARQLQADVAALRQVVKATGVAGIKAALAVMGRDCGNPRPPLSALAGSGAAEFTAALRRVAVLDTEPRGW